MADFLKTSLEGTERYGACKEKKSGAGGIKS
jgi:hypothetical protein